MTSFDDDSRRITDESPIETLPWTRVDGGSDVCEHALAVGLRTVGEMEAMPNVVALLQGFSWLENAIIAVVLEIAGRLGDSVTIDVGNLSEESSISELPWGQFGKTALGVRNKLHKRSVHTVDQLMTQTAQDLTELGLGDYDRAVIEAVLIVGRVK